MTDTEQKHTPGWNYEFTCYADDSETPLFDIKDSHGEEVAQFVEGEELATLIASAPELKAKVEEQEKRLGAYPLDADPNTTGGEVMRCPQHYWADCLKKWDAQTEVDGKWFLARPLPKFSPFNIVQRIQCAWFVFTGKADVLLWGETIIKPTGKQEFDA